MNLKLTLAALLIAPIMLTACAKKDDAQHAGQDTSSAAKEANQTTPEQQAAIDAIDKPVLDEKNTDVVEGEPLDESSSSEPTEGAAS